jgi:hypothetical protein
VNAGQSIAHVEPDIAPRRHALLEGISRLDMVNIHAAEHIRQNLDAPRRRKMICRQRDQLRGADVTWRKAFDDWRAAWGCSV